MGCCGWQKAGVCFDCGCGHAGHLVGQEWMSQSGAGAGQGVAVLALYLWLAAVTLLPALHKPVPAHGAAHQAVNVWRIRQAGCAGLLHERLQVGPAAQAERSGEWGAEGRGVSQEGGWWTGPGISGHPTLPVPSVMLLGMGLTRCWLP